MTTTAQKLLENNARRKALEIYNNGSATVYLITGEKQPYTQGYPIPAGTCYYSDAYNDQGELWVIGTATTDIRVKETLS